MGTGSLRFTVVSAEYYWSTQNAPNNVHVLDQVHRQRTNVAEERYNALFPTSFAIRYSYYQHKTLEKDFTSYALLRLNVVEFRISAKLPMTLFLASLANWQSYLLI